MKILKEETSASIIFDESDTVSIASFKDESIKDLFDDMMMGSIIIDVQKVQIIDLYLIGFFIYLYKQQQIKGGTLKIIADENSDLYKRIQDLKIQFLIGEQNDSRFTRK